VTNDADLVGFWNFRRRSVYDRSVDVQHVSRLLVGQRQLLVGEATYALHPLHDVLAGGTSAHGQHIRSRHGHIVLQPLGAVYLYGMGTEMGLVLACMGSAQRKRVVK